MQSEKPAHSKIGASSMYRWSACPGSVRLSEGIEKTSSKYAEEGTVAHEHAAEALKGKQLPAHLDQETKDAIKLYVETVLKDHLDEERHRNKLLVEHRFDLSDIYPGLYGTADAVLFHPRKKLLRVYDYKHGAGIAVEVENNSQLLYYGLGALMTSGFKASHVELVIVQPRCPHDEGKVRRWRFDAIELIDFSADLEEAARRTEDPEAPLNPGDHCRFCPAAGICPALNERALAIAREEFGPALSYSPEKLSEVLHWLPRLEAWIKSVREFAYGEAQHGRNPPGWKLVKKRATRKWKFDESETTHILEKIVPDGEDVFEHKLKSPAQVEKLLPRTERYRLEDLVTQESSGFALAPEDDPREPAKLDAKSDFSED